MNFGVSGVNYPGNFFVGRCTGIPAVRRHSIGDLAEVAPKRGVFQLHVLNHQGDRTNGKVPGDAAPIWKKPMAGAVSVLPCCSR